MDLFVYSRDTTKFCAIQVKALSKRTAVPLGKSVETVMGNYWITVNNVVNSPTVYILTPQEVIESAHRGEKDGRISYWLHAKVYEQARFKDAWERIGGVDNSGLLKLRVRDTPI